ncbi:hypothetical protein GN244_ATG11455 [Phytophthora infestans]|uniref:Uncharacterized protein n=1 Tax=Phytophthora infestans TaxID=4787 RepID=A0A833WIM5_PHYIN|nr:hypothetical protein GN244_ATG11455 [Phytophthora infestans]KAF4128710.1 hypothetical protein GN958_ATG22132 [Phytophthora infestans]KAI9986730.1 hypothetical protein PInf_025687 [Phytophthora infestans]
MSSLTWRSSWSSADGSVDVQVLDNNRGGVASLSSLPLQLIRSASDASVPCQMSLHWSPQPLRCLQLQLEVQCSARHVELHAEGTRRNMLGEEEQGEVYLGTFRGTKASTEVSNFTMSPIFKQSDRDCDILKSLQSLKVKFVSLTGDKNVLNLQQLQCVFVPMEPVAVVDTSASDVAAKVSGLNIGGAADVQTLLKGFQQTLEREMETKIARVIDAKLSTLSQRLAFSEQALFQLHKKMDAKDAHVQASLVEIQQKFSKLETQLSQFNAKDTENEEVSDEKNTADGDDVNTGDGQDTAVAE